MKTIYTLLVIASLSGALLFAEDGSYRGIRKSDGNITEMIIEQDPEVKQIYEDCKATQPTTLSKCLQDAVPDAKLQELYEKYVERGRKKSDINIHHEDDSPAARSKAKDPALQKLEKHLFNRLVKALHGDATDAGGNLLKQKQVDHELFYTLYETQLSKDVISALSAYCIEADPTNNYLIPDEADRASIKKKNLENLATFTPNPQTGTEENEAANQWNHCIQAIKHICYKTVYKNAKGDPIADYSKTTDAESVKRACLVTNHIKTLRKNLIATGEIKQELRNMRYKGPTMNASDAKLDTYNSRSANKGETIDDLTSMSSNEFSQSGFDEGVKEMKKTLSEDCLKNKDATKCSDFLASGEAKTTLEKMKLEHELKTRMMEEKLKKMTDEELKAYLLETKRSEAEIEALMQKDPQKIRDDVTAQYKAEQEALKKQLEDEVNKRTSTGTTIDLAQDENKLKQIETELSSKTDEYKQLIHYNNIVSSYLKIYNGSSGKASATGNIGSLLREIEDSPASGKYPATGSPGTASPSDQISQRNTTIKQQVMQSGNAPKEPEGDPATLEVNTINESLIGY